MDPVWAQDEHERFLEGIRLHPAGPWTLVAQIVSTQTAAEVSAHARSYGIELAAPVYGGLHQIPAAGGALVRPAEPPMVEEAGAAPALPEVQQQHGQLRVEIDEVVGAAVEPPTQITLSLDLVDAMLTDPTFLGIDADYMEPL